jgi:RND family efflux transporter MFP subunit
MSEENKSSPTPDEPLPAKGEKLPEFSPRVRRDLEIEAMRRHLLYRSPGILRPPEVPAASHGRAMLLGGVLLLVPLVAGGVTLSARASHERALAKATELAAVPTVAVVHPLSGTPEQALVLPCSLLAYEESPIYARTSGYLVRWYKDIGSRVAKGELLAKIDTPEVDQELNQARANREQIVAQLALAKISTDRWQNLLKSNAVSVQEADQQKSGYQQAQANLAAADANVRRLQQLEGFKEVYAPFTGVLIRRNVDRGALINAGAGGAGRELFDLARVDLLRVDTSVPQAYASGIKVGAKTVVTLQEFPGQTFAGVVARTAESIDPATRTLLTEIEVPNPDGRLLPGSYGQVHFAMGAPVATVSVPVNTMLFRAEGARVAVVGPGGKLALRAVTIGRDYGTTLEILSGLAPSDNIVVNPSDSLEDGQLVKVAQAGPRPGGV